jgi:molybdopterin-guanine dinucleotide biosynthesis protein MobB
MSDSFEDLPVLAISGFSGSGKTTLLERLIPRLREQQVRVAVIKHDAHGVDLDRPGKDSDRLFRAGADVVLRGPDEAAARWHSTEEENLRQSVVLLLADHDLVLAEGHKGTPLPKVWLCRQNEQEPPPDIVGVRTVLPWDCDRLPAAIGTVTGFLNQMWRRRPLYGGILVGGHSKRIGRPKQLLDLGGRTFVERVAQAIEDRVERIVCLGNGPLPPAFDNVTKLPDPVHVQGPTAGLVTALRWNPEAAWLVIACDQPLVRPEAIEWLLDQRGPGRWAVMPRIAGGAAEPFLAVYEPHSLSLLEEKISAGRTAPVAITDFPQVACPEPPTELEGCWKSINTPKEYEALLRSFPGAE